MAKDPAFLFYSQDFYSGTRTMLPEERACYIDLLIYQHQNGYVPSDLKRVQMFCSGCSLETLEIVLNTKFNQVVNHVVNQNLNHNTNHVVNQTDNQNSYVWLNQKLTKEITRRANHKPQRVASGTLAGLISKSKLNKKQKEKIKNAAVISDFIQKEGVLITDLDTIKSNVRTFFNQMVNQMVNYYETETETESKREVKNIKIEKKDFEEIKNVFNSVCKNLPAVKTLTNKRKNAIQQIANAYSLEEIGVVLKTTSESEFLNGGNESGWIANFDWILKPDNFLKILEGNYNKSKATKVHKINNQTEETVKKNLKNWS